MAEAFVELLRDVRRGVSIEELDNALAVLVSAVRETGRPGSLTYTLKVKKAGADTLMLEDAVKLAAPENAREATVFYADDKNRLSRNDPRQPELAGLRVLDHPSKRGEVING